MKNKLLTGITALILAMAPAGATRAAQFSDYEINVSVFWDFNDDSNPDVAVDLVQGIEGAVTDGTGADLTPAEYTADGLGRTGESGDKAMDFSLGTAGPSVVIDNVDWLNDIAANDRISISYWQQLTEIVNMTAMKGASPSSSGSERGFSMHSPWSNNIIYFDSAGCCDGGTQRISRNIQGLIDDHEEVTEFDFTSGWHHFVFVKNGTTKEIWVDGFLLLRATNTSPLPTDFRQLTLGSALNGTESLQGQLDDIAIFNGALFESEIKQLAEGLPATELVRIVDEDEDGLPDVYEESVGLDPTVDDAGLDPDVDGLTNLEEFENDTNPQLADTDDDGLTDKEELDGGTNPLNPDTDGDGLIDSVETNTGTFVSAEDTGTDPLLADTDEDGWPDGLEIKYGGDALDATVFPLEQGAQNLIAYWDFNDASDDSSAVDAVYGLQGEFRGLAEDPEQGIFPTSPEYTASGDGRTGSGSDRAVYFGGTSEQQHIFVEDGDFMSLTAPYDEVTITFWQRLDAIAGTFSFFGSNPSNPGGDRRGVGAHAPWSNANIFWDTAGCCGAGTQRVNRSVDAWIQENLEEYPELELFDFLDWHHYAFVKNGGRKEVYVDGILFMSSNGAFPLPDDFETFFIGSGLNGANSLQGTIDDFAVYASALFPLEIAKLAGGDSPQSLDRTRDSDEDGMPDIFEEIAGLDPDTDDSQDDPDEDGVVNIDELEGGTDPFDADSDDDGLIDGAETNTGTFVSADDTGTDPLNPDSDGDSLLDGVETNTGTFVSREDTGTDPNSPDSDNDSFLDGIEVIAGSSPTDAADVPLERGQVNLLAWWDFNDDSDQTMAVDNVRGLEATFIGGQDVLLPYYTSTGGGHTGGNDDRSVDLEFGKSQGLRIDDGEILGLTAVNDQITVSMWQSLYVVDQSNTFFWGVAPSTGNRGISMQTPWSNGIIYYDTAGCCDGATQRVSVALTEVPDPDNFFLEDWHHFVFVKNGPIKQIYIDGDLIFEGENTAPLPSDFTTAYVGVEPSGVNGIEGRVDDLAIYAAALTAEEIGMIFDGTAPDALPAREVIEDPEITALSLTDGNVVIEYTGTLQSAPTVEGPWTAVGGSSPYSEAVADGAMFFRVIP